MSNIQDTNNIPELQSSFEQLREIDADGKEWWNSRKLARVMGYGKYWNFERVIAKAQAWTSQKGYHLGEHFVEITEMAELFGVTQQNISYHLSQIEESGELHLSDAYKKNLLPSDKWSGEVMMYNLDVVIAVGYRVNSYEATQFRIWATQVLKEYLTKGFVLDDERLKGKNVFGTDYFDDLLDRIHEIHISERRYYQKITDIYSECSSDYDKDSEETLLFFKTVQNMMHYAVTKQTAAEIIYDRADAERPHMGLTTWKNAPDGRVVKSDVTVAKNYLSEKEVDSLNRLSNAFIDIAEQRAEDHILMTMADWSALLQRYMDLNNRPLLPDSGHVTHEQAVEKALTEYDKFRVIQDREIMSDFDKQLKLLFGDKKK